MEIQYRVVRNTDNTFTIQRLHPGSTTWGAVPGRTTFVTAKEAMDLKNMLEDEAMEDKHKKMIDEIIDPPRREKERKAKAEKDKGNGNPR